MAEFNLKVLYSITTIIFNNNKIYSKIKVVFSKNNFLHANPNNKNKTVILLT